MDNRAHVRLVDAHAERDRGNDDFKVSPQECGLHAVAILGRHAGVIGRRGHARLQQLGLRLGGLAGRSVHDRRPPRVVKHQPCQGGGPERRHELHEFDLQVLAPEPMNRALAVPQAQLVDHVALDDGRGRRRQRDHRGRAQGRQALAQASVLRPEVMAPHGDAMRLVNRDQARRALGQEFGKARHGQTLGSDVEKIQLARDILLAHAPRFEPVAPRMDPLGLEPLLAQLVRLVLHQCDQRADHDRGIAAGDSGQLVAQRLARSGRHDEQHVPAGHDILADRLLVGAEGGVPEARSQQFAQPLRGDSYRLRPGRSRRGWLIGRRRAETAPLECRLGGRRQFLGASAGSAHRRLGRGGGLGGLVGGVRFPPRRLRALPGAPAGCGRGRARWRLRTGRTAVACGG